MSRSLCLGLIQEFLGVSLCQDSHNDLICVGPRLDSVNPPVTTVLVAMPNVRMVVKILLKGFKCTKIKGQK